MAKQTKNLSLDPDAVRRGERYSDLHQTNLSKLVSNFLASLPLEGEDHDPPLTPAVHRLLGSGSGGTGVEDYRRHLVDKYGR
jgi:hypothetical protein